MLPGTTSASSGLLRTVNKSFLSDATSYVDDSGVGHVKVNSSKDWSDILPNDTTVRIVYEGSGSTQEVVIIPLNGTASNATHSFSGSMAESSPAANRPIDSSCDRCAENSTDGIDKGSTPTMLLIVGIVLGTIAIVTIYAVVTYSRRNRGRAYSNSPDVPFIVGSLPHHAAPQLSTLDADIRPDLWVEGQYQYSPTLSGLENSLSGTAILSNSNTIASRNRPTVDAYPFGSTTRQGLQYDASSGNNQRVSYIDGRLHDIASKRRDRRGMSPVVLYEQNSFEERKTSSRRKTHQMRRSLHRKRQQSPRMCHHRQRESQHQRRRHLYATRRSSNEIY